MDKPKKTIQSWPILKTFNKGWWKSNSFDKNAKWKDWLDTRNKPFAVPELKKISENKKQDVDFQTKSELMRDLEEKWWKNPNTAQDLFYWLSAITLKKNQTNNQYLFDFKNRLKKNILAEKNQIVDGKKVFSNGKEVMTFKRSKEDIREDLQRIYKKFTVHGQKTKTWLNKRADIDASASIILLEEALFTEDWYKDITFVENWKSWPGLNIDTSDEDIWGLNVEWYEKSWTTNKNGDIRREKSMFWTRAIVNEHWNGPASSTRMIYQILKDFDKIPEDKKWQIKRFVEFIDIVDDLWYQACTVVPYLERTIFGLYKFLPTWFIFDYFKDTNKTWFEYLDDKYLSQTKVNIFDMETKQKEEKSLKEISKEKKDRMEKSEKEFQAAESDWYFLMLGKTRFIVDLGWKIIDGTEAASIHDKWIIKVFPWTWDIYIYSPAKLSSKLWWFDVQNDQFVMDKIWSGKDINKLLNEFQYLPTREFTETKVLWSKINLKKEIIEYRQSIENGKAKIEQEKEAEKQKKTETRNIWLKDKFALLSDISIDDIKEWETHDCVVNNVRWNMLFTTFDIGNKVNGILHKNDADLDLFKSISIWDIISVNIKEIEKNWEQIKIKLILNNVVKQNQEKSNVA